MHRAEFTLSTPVLRDALAAAPGTTVELVHSSEGTPPQLSVLARGADINWFEEALVHDDSVRSSEVQARSSSLAQYEVTLSAAAGERAPMTWPHADGVEPLSGVGTSQGWTVRMRFDDCASLSASRDRCRERDVAFTLHDLYSREKSVESHIEPPLAGSADACDPIIDD
jgi:hypothetical protein